MFFQEIKTPVVFEMTAEPAKHAAGTTDSHVVCAIACRRFKKTDRRKAAVFQCIRDGLNNLGRRVKGGQYGTFKAVEIPFVFLFGS